MLVGRASGCSGMKCCISVKFGAQRAPGRRLDRLRRAARRGEDRLAYSLKRLGVDTIESIVPRASIRGCPSKIRSARSPT